MGVGGGGQGCWWVQAGPHSETVSSSARGPPTPHPAAPEQEPLFKRDRDGASLCPLRPIFLVSGLLSFSFFTQIRFVFLPIC